MRFNVGFSMMECMVTLNKTNKGIQLPNDSFLSNDDAEVPSSPIFDLGEDIVNNNSMGEIVNCLLIAAL